MMERVQRKKNSPTMLTGMWTGTVTVENSVEILQKTKNKVAIWSSSPTPRHVSGENYNLKWFMHPKLHSSAMYNIQDREAT